MIKTITSLTPEGLDRMVNDLLREVYDIQGSQYSWVIKECGNCENHFWAILWRTTHPEEKKIPYEESWKP